MNAVLKACHIARSVWWILLGADAKCIPILFACERMLDCLKFQPVFVSELYVSTGIIIALYIVRITMNAAVDFDFVAIHCLVFMQMLRHECRGLLIVLWRKLCC